MSALPRCESANIFITQLIANLCPLIDPNWDQESVIMDCRERLNKLAGKPIQCGALFFNKVLFRPKINNPQAQSIPLCIGNNPNYLNDSVQKQFGLSKDTTISLTQKEADFYLYYGNKVYHIQMSSECDCLYALPSPKDQLWDTSAVKVNNMIQDDWSNSFVTASYTWDFIVPLPS